MSHLLAGVELGGTKCLCILGSPAGEIRAQARVATQEPEATLARIDAVLEGWRKEHGEFAALGIASFGPIDRHQESRTYGFITTTTKPGWQGTDIAARFARRHAIDVGFDTDVNGAALAEGKWGAAQGLDDFAYITVGTGVGPCSAAITPSWGTFGRCERPAMTGRASAPFTAHASKVSRAVPRSRHGPECRRIAFHPTIPSGIRSRTRSASCFTRWCSPPRPGASFSAAA
jgi:hypothetical protein